MNIQLELEHLNELHKARELFRHNVMLSSFDRAYKDMINDRIINTQSFIIEELLKTQED